MKMVMKTLKALVLSVLTVLFLTTNTSYGQITAEESTRKGIEYAIQGNFEAAKREFEKALKVDFSYTLAEMSLKIIKDVTAKKIERETAIHLFTGVSYVIKRQYDRAISDFNKAIEIPLPYTFSEGLMVHPYLETISNPGMEFVW